jgi:hypothetical protein
MGSTERCKVLVGSMKTIKRIYEKVVEEVIDVFAIWATITWSIVATIIIFAPVLAFGYFCMLAYRYFIN